MAKGNGFILLCTWSVLVTLGYGQWKQIPKGLRSVTASVNYFWGVSSNQRIYRCQRPCTGNNWVLVDGALIQIDANDYEVWGVNSNHQIFKRPVDGSGNWTTVPGLLKHVSASGNGYIWGVNRADNIYKCKKPCSGQWVKINGGLKQIDGGEAYVYGVSGNNLTWRRPVDGSGGSWQQIPGTLMKQVTASGKNYIFGISNKDEVFRCLKPCIGNWELMSGSLSQCDATFDALVGVDANDNIFHRLTGI